MKRNVFERLALAAPALFLLSCGGAYAGPDNSGGPGSGPAGGIAGGSGTAGSGGTAGAGGNGGTAGVGGNGGTRDAGRAEGGDCSGSAHFTCLLVCLSDVQSAASCIDGQWDCPPPFPVRSTSCPPIPPPPPECLNDSPFFDCCTADGVDVPAQCLLTDFPTYHCPANTTQADKGKPCPRADGGRDGSVGDAGPPAQGCADPAVIDDMEDGDNEICPSDGRNQGWYWVGQASVRFPVNAPLVSDIIGGRSSSKRSLHFAATGLVSPTGLATDLKANAPYDASRYQGIEFWVRVPPAPNRGAPSKIIVGLDEVDTCTTACAAAYRAEVPVTGEWTHARVLFAGFAAAGGRTPDASRLKSLQFLLYPEDYEAWIDDVAFVPR